MSKSSDKSSNVDLSKLTLNELINKLQAINNWFNNSDLDIDQAISKFDESVAIASEIKARLASTETRINQIKLKMDKLSSNNPID